MPDLREFDTLIVNPPKSGCHDNVREAILLSGIPRVIFLSCNPQTYFNDLSQFLAGPYDVTTATVLDMFPHTKYAECISVLIREE